MQAQNGVLIENLDPLNLLLDIDIAALPTFDYEDKVASSYTPNRDIVRSVYETLMLTYSYEAKTYSYRKKFQSKSLSTNSNNINAPV